MANAFINFLNGAANGGVNFRNWEHASRLYLSNYYELTPKNGWIYFVRVNINPSIAQEIQQNDPQQAIEFQQWYNSYQGFVGLLSKQVDLPKFTIDTEVLNQYNRKTIIQKKIQYGPISITFHDDMANATTNLWKSYYQYYYADSIDQNNNAATIAASKYSNSKYKPFTDRSNYNYGLNNNQTKLRFIPTIEIFQLNQKQYTSFTLINPIIKEWSHDQLDQTQGSRLLTSKMTVEYETVVYDTSPNNFITSEFPGFNDPYHYDNTPSPLGIGGIGESIVFDAGGLVAGNISIFGRLGNSGGSILGSINASVGATIPTRNFGTLSPQTVGVNSLFSGNGYSQQPSPVGINVPSGSLPSDQVTASQINLGK